MYANILDSRNNPVLLNMSEYCMSDNEYFSLMFKNYNNAAMGPKYIDSFNTTITKMCYRNTKIQISTAS